MCTQVHRHALNAIPWLETLESDITPILETKIIAAPAASDLTFNENKSTVRVICPFVLTPPQTGHDFFL